MLPTNHGFDEFFGNLYHLNAEEEPETSGLSKGSPNSAKKFGPRGVIKSTSDGEIEDTGPLTKKRMETVDEEVTAGAVDFMERAVARRARSSCGGTPRGCTSTRISSLNPRV